MTAVIALLQLAAVTVQFLLVRERFERRSKFTLGGSGPAAVPSSARRVASAC